MDELILIITHEQDDVWVRLRQSVHQPLESALRGIMGSLPGLWRR